MPFWGDKQNALIEGQTECPFGGTNKMSFFRDEQNAILRDKEVTHLGDIQKEPLIISIFCVKWLMVAITFNLIFPVNC